MMRVILDTNIYGELVKDPLAGKIIDVINPSIVLIYGIDIIRKELRDTPKKDRLAQKNLRIALLALYDRLVKDHTIKTSLMMRDLAEKYDLTYRELGGKKPRESLQPDFIIVSCASLKGMDIIVTNDNATLASELSQKAFRIVNMARNLRMPGFRDYEKFKRWLI